MADMYGSGTVIGWIHSDDFRNGEKNINSKILKLIETASNYAMKLNVEGELDPEVSFIFDDKVIFLWYAYEDDTYNLYFPNDQQRFYELVGIFSKNTGGVSDILCPWWIDKNWLKRADELYSEWKGMSFEEL